MLIIVSDLHLGDGTCSRSVSASAFRLFAHRIQELASLASYGTDGSYTPIDRIDILLLGDCLDVLASARWLDTQQGGPDYVRPWTDQSSPAFAATVDAITEGCLAYNREGLELLRSLATDGIEVRPLGENGVRASERKRAAVEVRMHYLVGNHDWYYHLAGKPFDRVREKVVRALALSNPIGPFPHTIAESERISELLSSYGVYAQHGDIFDSFNCPQTRDGSAIGDVLAVEVFNRFSVEVKRQFGASLPDELAASLGELPNVRPSVATPLWIASQCRRYDLSDTEMEAVKATWDRLCREFLEQPLVRSADRKWRLQLELGMSVVRGISLKRMQDLALMARKPFAAVQQGMTLFTHALEEPAFRERSAEFIVYGHSHRYEHVPLDAIAGGHRTKAQMYLNAGTWHRYYDLAVNRPEMQLFVPFQVLTYLAFFNGGEYGGRRYETWSGAYADEGGS